MHGYNHIICVSKRLAQIVGQPHKVSVVYNGISLNITAQPFVTYTNNMIKCQIGFNILFCTMHGYNTWKIQTIQYTPHKVSVVYNGISLNITAQPFVKNRKFIAIGRLNVCGCPTICARRLLTQII
jgi:hypothetical protein